MVNKLLVLLISLLTLNALAETQLSMPDVAEFRGFTLVKVSPQYNLMDYQALMSARENIYLLLGSSKWPSKTLTPQQNKVTLINDLQQFNEGENFTFHIFSPSRNKIIGCIYLTPNLDEKSQLNFNAFFWLVPQYQTSEFSTLIKHNVTSWLMKITQTNSITFVFNQS